MDKVKIKLGADALQELRASEYGSYEDHISDDNREPPYDQGRLHIVELIDRSPHKTVVYLETEEEVEEFFVQASTGTWGLTCLTTLVRIHEQLLPLVDPAVAARIPKGTLGF